jgi:hypothetical protein
MTMTERVLPPVSIGTRPIALPADTPLTRPAREVTRPATGAAVRRGEAIITTPARAGILLGASAAVYAVSLAGVSALQAETDAQTAAARAPYVDQVTRIRAANDELERLVIKADAETRALAADYEATGAVVADYQARLDSLAVLVAEVQGSAAALPARIKLPTVSMAGSVGVARSSGGTSRPAAKATSGASGKP